LENNNKCGVSSTSWIRSQIQMLGTEGVCTGRLQQRLQMWYGVHMVPRQLFVSPPAIYSRIAASASAATHPCWCGVGDASQNRSPQRHPSVWHLHVRLHTTCWGAPALFSSLESISPPAIYSRIAASASATTHPCWCGVGAVVEHLALFWTTYFNIHKAIN